MYILLITDFWEIQKRIMLHLKNDKGNNLLREWMQIEKKKKDRFILLFISLLTVDISLSSFLYWIFQQRNGRVENKASTTNLTRKKFANRVLTLAASRRRRV